LQLFDLRAGGKVKLEVVVVHLRLCGRRVVIDDEQAHALHGSAIGLKANDVGGDAEAGNLGCDVVHIHVGRVHAGRRHLVVSNSLMDGANEMRAGGSGELEAESSAVVGLGRGGDFHGGGEVDEDDLVACSGLVGGAVGDGADQGLGGGGG
jgi:hypothetical protein